MNEHTLCSFSIASISGGVNALLFSVLDYLNFCRVMTLPRNRKISANIFLAALACSDSLHLLFSVHDWLLSMIEYK